MTRARQEYWDPVVDPDAVQPSESVAGSSGLRLSQAVQSLRS